MIRSNAATAVLTATITPSSAINKDLIWTSNNNSACRLSPSGLTCLVTITEVGEYQITCTSSDTTNGTISDTCEVTVIHN